jgi:hypothetical protein
MIDPVHLDEVEYLASVPGILGGPPLAA